MHCQLSVPFVQIVFIILYERGAKGLEDTTATKVYQAVRVLRLVRFTSLLKRLYATAAAAQSSILPGLHVRTRNPLAPGRSLLELNLVSFRPSSYSKQSPQWQTFKTRDEGRENEARFADNKQDMTVHCSSRCRYARPMITYEEIYLQVSNAVASFFNICFGGLVLVNFLNCLW